MNYRVTVTAGIAVVLASLSMFSVIQGVGWFYAGVGAVITVSIAGTLTRLPAVRAATCATVLTALAAAALLAGPSWFARAGGLALVAVVAASFSRLRVLPAVAHLATYLAALFLYLNLVFAGSESVAAIVPTARSLQHLSFLVSQGGAERQYYPPVPGGQGVCLLAAAGIGLMAVAVDVLAIRLRRPAIAGLPLLVLFSVPVATKVKDVGLGEALAFCLGISGYLALLSADGRERLRLWGRLVTFSFSAAADSAGQSPDTKALGVSGRRIGAAAVGLGLIIPLLLPGLKLHDLFATRPTGGTGCCGTSLPTPLVQMQSLLNDSPARLVLTYHTTARDPQQQYLQVYVLSYDSASDQWTEQDTGPARPVGGPLAAVPGLTGNIRYRTATSSVTINQAAYGGGKSFLPLPYAPERLHVGAGSWSESISTLMVYGHQALGGLTYRVTSKEPDPAPGQLQAAASVPNNIKQDFGTFPDTDRAKLTAIARQAVGTATSPLAQATNLQNWFAADGNFSYSVNTRLPNSAAGLLRFLTTVRKGDCQQFSFAMAILARLMGIPSRVAVGFTAGTRQRDGTWRVTTADAHAWPELYFAGAGWLRFEPTPSGTAPGQGSATAPDYAAPPTLGKSSSTNPFGQGASPPATTPGRTGAGGRLHQLAGADSGSGPGSAKSGGGFPVFPVVAAFILVLASTPRLARSLTRRARWHSARGDAAMADAAWRELRDDLADYGIGLRPSESARAIASRIGTAASLDDAACRALRHIAAAQERARYAPAPLAGDSLRAETTTVRRAMSRSARPAQRWQAWLLPASTLAPLRSAMHQSADIFGWLDAGTLRLRRRVPPWHPRRAE